MWLSAASLSAAAVRELAVEARDRAIDLEIAGRRV
jgi:hypothetical protein